MSDDTPGERDGNDEARDRSVHAPFTEADATDLSTLQTTTNHFYRGEMDRITTWRNRMDQTTNWAVVVMAAILTWAFSSPDNPHYVILIGLLAACVFLFIEAQRFQEYDAWRTRVRVLQQNLFAEGFEPRDPESADWRAWLSDDLREPTIHLSLVSAVGHRLQHVYLPLVTVLVAAWALRIGVFDAETTWRQEASIGTVPGEVVVGAVALGYLAAAALAVQSVRSDLRREFEYDVDESADRA